MTRLLLVDDDAILRSRLAVLLSNAGYQVHQASNGNEALKIHRRQPVEIMVVELVLPEKDGFELLMEMRARPLMPKFIALAGGGKFPMHGCLSAAKQLGAHHVLTKPFQPEQLLVAVNQILGMRRRKPPGSRASIFRPRSPVQERTPRHTP